MMEEAPGCSRNRFVVSQVDALGARTARDVVFVALPTMVRGRRPPTKLCFPGQECCDVFLLLWPRVLLQGLVSLTQVITVYRRPGSVNTVHRQ